MEQRRIDKYVKPDDWKEVFRKDIKSKLSEVRKEFKLYKKTSSIIYLQQACNKMFSYIENRLMLKYDVRVSNYGQLRELVRKNEHDTDLLLRAKSLHQFYYNAEMQMPRYDAEDNLKALLKKLS